MNEKLNDILENKKGLKEMEAHEIDTLNDYFNLCGEEYLFYRRVIFIQKCGSLG